MRQCRANGLALSSGAPSQAPSDHAGTAPGLRRDVEGHAPSDHTGKAGLSDAVLFASSDSSLAHTLFTSSDHSAAVETDMHTPSVHIASDAALDEPSDHTAPALSSDVVLHAPSDHMTALLSIDAELHPSSDHTAGEFALQMPSDNMLKALSRDVLHTSSDHTGNVISNDAESHKSSDQDMSSFEELQTASDHTGTVLSSGTRSHKPTDHMAAEFSFSVVLHMPSNHPKLSTCTRGILHTGRSLTTISNFSHRAALAFVVFLF